MPWIYAAAQVCKKKLYRQSSWFEARKAAQTEIDQMAESMHIGAMRGRVFVIRQWLQRIEGDRWLVARVVKTTVAESEPSLPNQHVAR